ncbi:rho GTPase-activating protein 12-like isoform X2 [Lytechinus pictus]|uniref:rho GTPase-activating protein 12-like isoform X2 n=1 Tax=Lytechinus pictus TaxID=7653 RepID=UPI0030B9C889
MVSDGGGRGEDPKVPIQQLRTGKISQGRPHSFHPHLRSSSPSLPSESRLFDDWDYEKKKEEIKRKFNNRISVYGNPSPYDMEVREKEGMLTMMLMKDRGRQKKSRPGYAVLAGSQLKYYKDHKNFERDASNPEVSLNLWRTEVGWTRSRTPGKKLIFELSTDQGIYLVQGEDETTSQSWYEAIKGAVAGRTGTLTSPDDNDDNLSPLTPSPGLSPPSNDVHAMKKNNSKIRGKLKIFFNSRPDKDDLRRKGILQEENVFGKDIRKLCEKERTPVPNFVNQCIKYIDRRGLECDGIYRVSGNLSLIQKLRFQVDQEKPVDLDSSPWKDDIHVITGALKLYFRELPEPLFTFSTFDKFLASITQIPNPDQKILAFRALFGEMPRVNQDTIFALFSHLKRVMDNVQHNRMPAKNLATVFGPTLMWPERESMNMTMATVYQNQVMEFVLLEFDNIFRS